MSGFIRTDRIYTRTKPTRLIQRIKTGEYHDPGYIRFNERQQWNRIK